MSLMKNQIPILEYDDSQLAVVMPNRHNLYNLPKKAVFPFLADEVEKYAAANNCQQIGEFISATKIYPIFQTTYKGEEICFCQAPVGAAAATQILDFLIGYGVEKIISAGSCGALVDFEENKFLIPVEALRCEGHPIIIYHHQEQWN